MTSDATTNEPQFRLTPLWPGVTVPVPPVAVGKPITTETADGTWIMFGAFYDFRDALMTSLPLSPRVHAREIPDELVIRELVALNVHNDTAVVQFLAQHGVIARRSNDSNLALRCNREPLVAPRAGVDKEWLHLDEARLHLAEVQALSRHFLALRSGHDVCAAWDDYLPQASAKTAMLEFVRGLNRGLQWYHVRIEANIEVAVGDPVKIGDPQCDLYSALCLQLYNLLVVGEEAPSRCRECGSAFYRHRGRAKHGQNHRTGVVYCSKRCADRDASRARRLRNRNKKETIE